MRTTIERDGDEYVVVIPQEILDRGEVRIGDEVEVSVGKGLIAGSKVITIKRSEDRHSY